MKKKIFDVHGFFSFAIFGNGRLYEYLCYQHDFFVSKKLRNYSFSIEVVDKMEYKNSKRLLDGKEEFIRDGSYFIYNFNGASVRFDGSMELKMQKKIEIDEGFSKMKANTIIDMFFRIFNLKNEVYLVHAACIEKENKGVLVPAWKGMGKTNACLEFVKEGFSFLADDKVWVGVDKKVYSYPRYVVIKGDDNFEFIDKLRVREKLRLVFRFILSKLFNLKRRPISIVVNMLAKPLVKYYRIQELFDQVASKVASRPGGYTRIIKTGARLGDNAEMCFIELVDYNELMLKETKAPAKPTPAPLFAKAPITAPFAPAVTKPAPTTVETISPTPVSPSQDVKVLIAAEALSTAELKLTQSIVERLDVILKTVSFIPEKSVSAILVTILSKPPSVSSFINPFKRL